MCFSHYPQNARVKLYGTCLHVCKYIIAEPLSARLLFLHSVLLVGRVWPQLLFHLGIQLKVWLACKHPSCLGMKLKDPVYQKKDVRMTKCTLKEFEGVSEGSNTLLKVRMWSFLKTATPFFPSHPSCHGLHRVVAAFWFSVFAFVFAPVFLLFFSLTSCLFLLTLIPIFLWHHDNGTASAAIVLEMTNLRKCTQLFVTRTFKCIPKRDGCLHTSHTFNWIPKVRWKLGPHPPTENTLCEISSLALRCSAIIFHMSFTHLLLSSQL